MKLLLLLLAGSLAAARVEVDASKPGFLVPDELYGHNWNAYEKSGDGKDEEYNAAVRAMGATQMRIPGGGYASFRIWDDISCGGKDASWLLDLNAMLAFAKATGTKLQPIVNFGGHWCGVNHGYDAAVKKATDWVKYMNVSPKAHPAKYWEIGNEIFFKGDKAHTNGKTYGTQYARFHKAMKAVDPTIQLGFCMYENRDKDKLPWNVDALKALKATGVIPDFFVLHAYPIWLPDNARTAKDAPDWNKNWYADHEDMDKLILSNVGLIEKYTKETDQTIAELLPAANGRPYWMTEFRTVLELKYVEYVDAMGSGQMLLEMARLGWKGSNIWALKNGFSTKNKSDFGLLRTGANPGEPDDNPKNSPRPAWYLYPYLSKIFGRQMVEAKGEGSLRAWASTDAQGSLTVFLANNGLKPETAELNLVGFKPGPQGGAWLFEPQGTTVHGKAEPILQRRDISINGVTRPKPASLPGPRAFKASAKFSLRLPPAAMMLVKVPKAP